MIGLTLTSTAMRQRARELIDSNDAAESPAEQTSQGNSNQSDSGEAKAEPEPNQNQSE